MEQIFIVEDETKFKNELFTLLDLNLPVYDGFYICKEIRKKSDIPIIIVTSSKSYLDELDILNLGADDFITKPFNPRILLAHISSVLKRVYGHTKSLTIVHNGAMLDVLKSKVSHRGQIAELTKNELEILKILMENKGNIIPRNAIISSLWDMAEFVEDSTLTVNINRLRKKLEDIGLDDYLITKRGQGYMV